MTWTVSSADLEAAISRRVSLTVKLSSLGSLCDSHCTKTKKCTAYLCQMVQSSTRLYDPEAMVSVTMLGPIKPLQRASDAP